METESNPFSYAPTTVPLLSMVDELEKRTKIKVKENFPATIEEIENLINADYAVGNYLMRAVSLAYFMSGEKVRKNIISSYHKGLFAIIAGYKLTKTGYVGSARPNFRYLAESLIVGKFCSLTKDELVYNKWQEGGRIIFKNDILKRISQPTPTHFEAIFEILSAYTHSSKYSQQISFEWPQLQHEIFINFSLLRILIHFHCHILLSHIMPSSVRYYIRYFDDDDIADLKSKKSYLRNLLAESKHNMSSDAKECVLNFRSKWQIAPVRNKT